MYWMYIIIQYLANRDYCALYFISCNSSRSRNENFHKLNITTADNCIITHK